MFARLFAARLLARHGLAGLRATHLAPTDWISDQPVCLQIIDVQRSELDSSRLLRFDRILRTLPPRLRSKTNEVMETKTAWFWIDSVVRPLAADNIALGRPW